ncbi:MAG: lysylphosphatidylglycerol synthase domain-containing protein [Bacteroidota bacterium]
MLLGLAALCYIVWQFMYTKASESVWVMFHDIGKDEDFTKIIFLVLILMLVNWGIEALKWKLLIKKIERITFGKAVLAVLSGLALGVLTPNRIGEFLGRIMSVEKSDRRQAFAASVAGSFSQLLITLLFGAFAMIWYFSVFSSSAGEINAIVLYSLIFSFVICALLVLLMYFNLGALHRSNPTKKWSQKINKFTQAFTFYNRWELLLVLVLSMIRYVVFSFQFYLLLNFFGCDLKFEVAMQFIAIIYFVVALIPTVALTEIGVKGSAAVFFLSAYTGNEAGILAASFSIWLINLAIPASIGAILLYRVKIFKK